jgi:SRSO17 transposase
VRQDLSGLFKEVPSLTGLILDESGHRKRGKKSVGVSRQYLGSIGKVDNGQVAVFAALSQGDNVGIVNSRLYLPKTWTEDPQRCDKAGIPTDQRQYRTKPELALEMVQEMEGEIAYSWVGGDSIYGNSKTLRQGLQQLEKLFVMDVSEDLLVFVEAPEPYVPVSPPGKGRKKSSYISKAKPLKVKDLAKQLPATAWKTYTVRAGTKGPLLRQVTVREVFVWSAKRPTDGHVEQLRLVISCNTDGTEIKYSCVGSPIDQ